MSPALVSVVTPAWNRHDLLLKFCVPSVQAQDYPAVEHVIVSDGPDPELGFTVQSLYPALHHPVIRYAELPEHRPDPNYGTYARRRGAELAAGDYITYNDSDDALRPGHCTLLAAALDDHPAAGFVLSRMLQHQRASEPVVIGRGDPGPGNTGTCMIMHRRELLDIATWGRPAPLEDWGLVQEWLAAGVTYATVDAETADVWPSQFTRR